MADGCTAEVNACIDNPFNEAVVAGESDNCTLASYDDTLDARKVAYCGLESTDNAGTLTANADTDGCQALATALVSTNACIGNPFADACTDELLGGATGAKLAAQTLRTTYCATQGSSDDIRQDTGLDAVCRGAANQVCNGDALFDKTTTGYDCFNDKTTYNDAREAHYTACIADETTRTGAGTVCMNAMSEICTTEDGLQTNPFAPICTEGNSDPSATTAEQLAVIKNCALLNSGQQAMDANIRCRRGDAAAILSTCSLDARNAICDDYAATGEVYQDSRRGQYVLNCADADALTGQSDADFCPEANVKPLICVTNGQNSRPFAPICAQGGADANLEVYKKSVLDFCIDTGTPANANDARCRDATTAMTISNAATQCGSAAAADNPFGTKSITGFTAMVDCETIGAYSGIRTMFQTSCRTAVPGTSSLFTSTTCAEVVADICTATSGANANPFSNICNATTHANARATFATSCVGATAPLSNGATCPAAVIECANNPFGSTCVIHGTTNDDPAYNGQKRVVLDACNTGANIIANLNTRCDDAVEDEPCLRDPANCTTGATVFAPATGDDGGAYLSALLTDRLTYCNTDDNINAQKNICRSANSDFAYCTRNPWSDNCEDDLGADPEAFRNTRLAYCRLRTAAELRNNTLNVVVNFVSGTLDNTDNFNLCFAGSSIDADGHDQHAVGAICAGTSNVTVNMKLNAASADPFTAVCRAFSRYNDERLTRIVACAGFDDPAVTSGTTCNWAQQANLCSNDTSGLDAQCGTLNIPSKWVTSATSGKISDSIAAAIEFTNSQGNKNAIISNFGNTNADVTFTEPTLELHTDLTGGRSGGRIVGDDDLPNVRFYSARTAAVPGQEALAAINEGDALPGPDGDILTLGDNTVAGPDDTRPEVLQRDEIPAGTARFFAGIEVSSGNVGRPFFNRGAADPTATWTGKIDWIGIGDAANATAARDFSMLVNFGTRTLQGAVSIAEVNPLNTGLHLVIDANYSAAGIIKGTSGGGVTIRRYTANPNDSGINIGAASASIIIPGTVTGLIGSEGAVGVFVSDDTNPSGYGGGFIVKP